MEDCSGNRYNSFIEECIKTNINKIDTDSDGWWDGIEVKAEKNPNDSSNYL